MATWPTIEDGMPKGGTAIQKALEALNEGKQEASPVITKHFEPADMQYNSLGGMDLIRHGNTVIISGSFKLKAGVTANTSFLTIPNGFVPTSTVRVVAYGTATSVYILVIDPAIKMLKLNSSAGEGLFLTFQTAYMTNDDLPD